MNKCDVTVSIVVYRSPIGEVVAAVNSLLLEECSVHLQIVDNNSGLEYYSELSLALPDSSVLVSSGRNGGFGFGHNFALRNAPPSRYHLILNPDVTFNRGALTSMIGYLDENSDVGMVAPRVQNIDGTLQPLNKRNPNVLDLLLRRIAGNRVRKIPYVKKRLDRYEMKDLGYDRPVPVEFLSGCCLLIRRELMERVGGFDEQFFLYFEDADLTRRVNLLSSSWFYPDAVINHVWHRDSAKSFRAFKILVSSAAKYFRKWGLSLW